METIENDDVKFWINDGILFSEHKRSVLYGVEESKAIIEMRHEISNNTPQYWCYHLGSIRSTSNEGQKYIDEHGQDFIAACGVVVNSFMAKFLIEAFITVKKPRVPMKIFKSEEKAVLWLKEMKRKNN